MLKVTTVTSIDKLLPQSQCQQCGYPCCNDYADAIINHQETINKCAFGGEAIMLRIAETLQISPQPTDKKEIVNKVAIIDEQNCIGCTKCISVCPVEAIIGAKRVMHTIISQFCTGCNLCVDPCPTDCIQLIEFSGTPISADAARSRFNAKKARSYRQNKPEFTNQLSQHNNQLPTEPRKIAVAEAIARAKAKRAQLQDQSYPDLYKK